MEIKKKNMEILKSVNQSKELTPTDFVENTTPNGTIIISKIDCYDYDSEIEEDKEWIKTGWFNPRNEPINKKNSIKKIDIRARNMLKRNNHHPKSDL